MDYYAFEIVENFYKIVIYYKALLNMSFLFRNIKIN
jgi:hypothetical protein